MSRRINFCIGLVAIVLLWLPLGARFVGTHAQMVENRQFITAPSLSSGWDFFKELGPYINDHLPLRQRAIRTDAWIDVNLFKEDPSFGGNGSPRVLSGSNGILFINDALADACAPHLPPSQSAEHFDRLATIVQKSGRTVITAIAPDKSSVIPQYLPKGLALRKCFDEQNEILWSALRSRDIPGFIDLKSLLIEASLDTREPLFFRKDTHWDPTGSLVAVRGLVNALAPGLWNEKHVVNRGVFTYVGDLTGLRGIPESDEAPGVAVERPGVSVLSTSQAPGFDEPTNIRTVRTSTESALVDGKTLFLLDSFGYAALPQLAPFFRDLTTVSLNDFEPQKFVRLINDADTVIIMSVERSFSWRMAKESGSDSFLKLLSTSIVSR